MLELLTPLRDAAASQGDGHDGHESRALTRILARALDEVDYGIVLAQADATVLHANHRARSALGGGQPLQLLDQRLRTRDPRDLSRLHEALQAAAERNLRRLIALGRDDELQTAAVVPVGEHIAAVVLGKAKVCEDLSIECFARSHALTPAETRVLVALGQGVAPAEIAVHKGVKLSTVRTQIGAIRDKVGVGSINALIHTIAGLPPIVSTLRN